MTPTPDSPTLILDLPDEAATAAFGAVLASALRAGDVVALTGGLGSGKTALSRAILRVATGNPDEEVPSPTFTLVQIYDGIDGTAWWHFDLYRLKTADEAYELGIDEAFDAAVSLIEWPERLGSLLPKRALRIALSVTGPTARRAEISGPAALLQSPLLQSPLLQRLNHD